MFNPDIDNLAQAINGGRGEVKKALTAGSSNFNGVNLTRPAKLMIPSLAPLRNRLATEPAENGGLYAWWKAQIGAGTWNYGTNMGTAEDTNGTVVDGTALDFQALYKKQSVDGKTTVEAIATTRGFDDANAIEVSRALAINIQQEEINILGGNHAALAAPTGLVGAAVGSGSLTVPAYFTVTALTMQGMLTNATSNSNVGESVIATEVGVSGSGASKAYYTLSWNPVPGAVAYKVYAGGTGAEKLVSPAHMYYVKKADGTKDSAITLAHTGQTYVTVNAVAIDAVASSTAYPSTDGSANANIFEGMYAWAQKNTIYGQALPSNHLAINQGGFALTQAADGIAEFDTVLGTLWTTWKIGPTKIITDPMGAAAVSAALVAANNAPTYRVEIGPERGGFTGGIFVKDYVNKYASSILGQQQSTIEVWAHPDAAPGTFLFLSENVPYAHSREARGFALDVLIPYSYFPLAPTTAAYPFELYHMQTLKCFHPLAQASIQGVRVE